MDGAGADARGAQAIAIRLCACRREYYYQDAGDVVHRRRQHQRVNGDRFPAGNGVQSRSRLACRAKVGGLFAKDHRTKASL